MARRSLDMYTWRLTPDGLRTAVEDSVLSPFGVNLSDVAFVTPGGVVGLACILEEWTLRYGAVPVVLPNKDVTAYMHRMDFFDHFTDRLRLDRDIGHLEHRGRYRASLSELRTVRDADDVTEVTKQFCGTLSDRGVPKEKVRRSFAVISETLENAVDHASSPCGAYTAIQTWPSLNKVAAPTSLPPSPRVGRTRSCKGSIRKAAIGGKVKPLSGTMPVLPGRGLRASGIAEDLAGISGASGGNPLRCCSLRPARPALRRAACRRRCAALCR